MQKKINFISELMKQANGERHLEIIEKERRVRTLVYWELWPNGENFRVLKIIDE